MWVGKQDDSTTLQSIYSMHRWHWRSRCKRKSELQNPKGKNSTLGIASAWWNRARHQWQRDHQDPEHLPHSAHEHWHVKWICEQFSNLSCYVFVTLDYTPHLRTSPGRRWTPLTTPTSSQVLSPTPTTSRRLTSSPTQSPWPTHSSPSKGSSRMWSTMTPHSICSSKHTEYMSIRPSEKACLSVSRRRPCPIERGDPLESDLLDQMVRSSTLETHRLGRMSGRSLETRIPGWLRQKKCTKIRWNYWISAQEELHRAQAEERRRRDQQLLHAQLLKQNLDLREAHQKSLNEMTELKRLQSSTFDTIARRRLVEDRDTILELTGKIQELQNEINCMNDSIDFQDAESVRSGHSHVASLSHLIQFLKEC